MKSAVLLILLSGCAVMGVDKHVEQCLDAGKSFHYIIKSQTVTFDCN